VARVAQDERAQKRRKQTRKQLEAQYWADKSSQGAHRPNVSALMPNPCIPNHSRMVRNHSQPGVHAQPNASALMPNPSKTLEPNAHVC
jgi:hypothetical protein